MASCVCSGDRNASAHQVCCPLAFRNRPEPAPPLLLSHPSVMPPHPQHTHTTYLQMSRGSRWFCFRAKLSSLGEEEIEDAGGATPPCAPPRPDPPMSRSSELKAAGWVASLVPDRPWCLGLELSSQPATGLWLRQFSQPCGLKFILFGHTRRKPHSLV